MSIKKRAKKYAVRLALLGVASAIAFPAMAQTYSGNNIYKVTRPNGTPQVIVANRTPGERLSISYPNATSTRRVTANACGLVVLRDGASSSLTDLVSVDGAMINQATLPTQLLPRCVNGSLEEARAANFKTGTGEVVVVKTPNTVYEAAYGGGRDRSVTANACGFAAINESSTFPWASNPTIMLGGTTYTVATLPTADLEPLCRSGQLYMPASW
jgi:hypothetical protein